MGTNAYISEELMSLLNVFFPLQIYEIPFFVALDHKKEAIVVAVRGTLSFEVSSISCV